MRLSQTPLELPEVGRLGHAKKHYNCTGLIS